MFVDVCPSRDLSTDGGQAFGGLSLAVIVSYVRKTADEVTLPLFAAFYRHIVVVGSAPSNDFPVNGPSPARPGQLTRLRRAIVMGVTSVNLTFSNSNSQLVVISGDNGIVVPSRLLCLLTSITVDRHPRP